MVCLKFESCNIILCILILYAFMCDLETEATNTKKYSIRHDKVAMLEAVEVPNKLINALVDKKDKVKIDIEKPTVIDILCQFCKTTKDKTCKTRFCSRCQFKAPRRLQTPVIPVLRLQGGQVYSLPPNRNIYKRSTRKDEKVAILGDAYCALCITIGNLTCIQRYCNQASKKGPASTKKHRLTATA